MNINETQFLIINNFVYLQIQWIEEQYNVFALVLRQIDFFELTVNDSGAGKIWCWFVQCWCHFV